MQAPLLRAKNSFLYTHTHTRGGEKKSPYIVKPDLYHPEFSLVMRSRVESVGALTSKAFKLRCASGEIMDMYKRRRSSRRRRRRRRPRDFALSPISESSHGNSMSATSRATIDGAFVFVTVCVYKV